MIMLRTLVLCLVVFLSCNAQKSTPKISFSVPTINQEATAIWRTINDIDFLEKQGYNINLPKDDLIDSLIFKSKNGTFGNNDFSSIYNLLEANFFNADDYTIAIKKIQEQEALINEMIKKIQQSRHSMDWNFKMFDVYKVVCTLYGTGGSYNADEGSILIFTTPEGAFKNYDNPANTIIHEITHIGIEEAIISKYKIPHSLKERIVDTFVFLNFKEDLPDYKIQDMGDKRIDQYLKTKEDIKSLGKFSELIMREN